MTSEQVCVCGHQRSVHTWHAEETDTPGCGLSSCSCGVFRTVQEEALTSQQESVHKHVWDGAYCACGAVRDHREAPASKQRPTLLQMAETALGQWLNDFGSTNELSQRSRIILDLIRQDETPQLATSKDVVKRYVLRIGHSDDAGLGGEGWAVRMSDHFSSYEPAQKWVKAEDYDALRNAGSPVETTDHIANEWADMATNGIVWLRNIRDGISTPVEALTEMESNLQRIQKLRAVEPTGVLPPAFQSLLDLQPNWDSYGAKRINLACVQKAYEIWRQLAGIWLPVPHSDGTVGLEQHQGGFDIEIDVDLSLPPEKSSESSPVLDHRFIPEGMDPGICQKCGATRASHRDTREGIVFAEEAAESSPDQLVGALQDRVHQDLGRVRAGRAAKAVAPRCKYKDCTFFAGTGGEYCDEHL